MSLQKKIFEKIHTSNLVYNTCWEDPRCDRQLLRLDEKSRVVVITSAGCNALDYLLDRPASVDAVDMNPRQNALLDLKKASIEAGSHADFFQFFGEGKHPDAGVFFRENLENRLDSFAKNYWRRHLRAFEGRALGSSFYYFGSSGWVAFWLKKFLESDPATARSIRQMFDAGNMYAQRLHYYRIEPRLLNRFVAWVLNRHLVQSMLGVPRSQQIMARRAFDDGMTGYFRHCFRKVFVELPLSDNYFWRLYFFGKYDRDCCPNYLQRENFEPLRQQIGNLKTHTASLADFLKNRPGKYTHFVLLDHQDWLAANDRPALDAEWRLIFENAAPGAKVLFRSAAFDRSFLPKFAAERVEFDDFSVRETHVADRVGTYASVHLGKIK